MWYFQNWLCKVSIFTGKYDFYQIFIHLYV